MQIGDSRSLENFSMWAMYQSKVKPDIPLLKELVNDWVTMCVQKTAGQRKDPKEIPWKKNSKAVTLDNLERIKMGILCEAVALVLSGKLDDLPEEEGNKYADTRSSDNPKT